MKTVDFLVLGQGIAGTVFAFEAMQRGYSVHVVDASKPNSASRVAGGLINPITGRFMKKSWIYDDLLPVLLQTYRDLEQKLNIKCLHELPIMRLLRTVEEVNNWEIKRLEPDYADFMGAAQPIFDDRLAQHVAAGEIKNGFWLDTNCLLDAFRNHLHQLEALTEAYFEVEELNANVYRNISFQNLVFCEGITGKQHPFFSNLPLRPAKGEVMVVKIPGPDFPFVLNKNMLLIPLGNGFYKVGATLVRQHDDSLTSAGLEELKEKLESVVGCEYEIIEHKAGIRPTVRDRRPLMGKSSERENTFVFNGLGTKGVSLAPYMAKLLLDDILNIQPLSPELDWKRKLMM